MMFALVDCNNFFVSCERVFNPVLKGKPVIILSGDERRVMARSKETKELGIKIGTPLQQIEEKVHNHRVNIFSCNSVLYGDMSHRVIHTLSRFVSNIEVISMDRMFLALNEENDSNMTDYGNEIVYTISKGIGIPVSVGIAATKTLARIAAQLAKQKNTERRVFFIDGDEKRKVALQMTGIKKVWGLNRHLFGQLQSQGVQTAYDFAQLPESWVHEKLDRPGEHTWSELNGEPCIDTNTLPLRKKQICASPVFEQPVTDLVTLSGYMAAYANMCAARLKKHGLCAVSIMVFVHTDGSHVPCFRNHIYRLPFPTNSGIELAHHALAGLSKIFVKGYRYHKVGIIIMETVHDFSAQDHLAYRMDFLDHQSPENNLPEIREKPEKSSNEYSQKGKRPYAKLTPCYSTRLCDSIKVRI